MLHKIQLFFLFSFLFISFYQRKIMKHLPVWLASLLATTVLCFIVSCNKTNSCHSDFGW